MKRTVLLLTILTAAASISLRASYHGEAAVNYGDSGGDSRSYGLNLSWFVDPLTATAVEPMAEAVFSERPRTVSLSVARSEIDSRPSLLVQPAQSFRRPLSPSLVADASRPQADGIPDDAMSRTSYDFDYVHRRPSSPHVFSIGARYATMSVTNLTVIYEPETPPTYIVSRSRSDIHGFQCGYAFYVQPRLTIGLRSGGTWQENGNEYADTETRNLNLDLNARWLVPLGGDRWLALDGSVVRAEADTSIRPVNGLDFGMSTHSTAYHASAAFYLSRSTSIGLSGSHQPDFDFNSAGLSVRHFFNDRVSIGASASRAFPKHGEESTSYGGVLACRL